MAGQRTKPVIAGKTRNEIGVAITGGRVGDGSSSLEKFVRAETALDVVVKKGLGSKISKT